VLTYVLKNMADKIRHVFRNTLAHTVRRYVIDKFFDYSRATVT